MARPRNFTIEEAESSLLDVFWGDGYEGSSLRNLCDATGQRPASLYAAFGDKDQMYQAAMRRYLEWIDRQLTPAVDGADGVRHVLETTCRLTVEDRDRKGCLIVNSVGERENLSPQVNATVQASFDRLRALLHRQVHATFISSPPPDADEMVNLLMAATVSIRLLGRASASDAELASIASGAVHAFNRWADSSSS